MLVKLKKTTAKVAICYLQNVMINDVGFFGRKRYDADSVVVKQRLDRIVIPNLHLVVLFQFLKIRRLIQGNFSLTRTVCCCSEKLLQAVRQLTAQTLMMANARKYSFEGGLYPLINGLL